MKQVQEFCKRFNITEDQFYGRVKIEGSLDLSYNQLSSLPEGFNPTVGGSLSLNSNQLSSLPDGFNPTVGGSLDLSYNQLSSLPEGFNPTVGGGLSLYNNKLSSLPEGFNPTVGGGLYLSNNKLSSLPEGFNPTVGGYLDLSSNQLSSLPEGFNPTVWGSLDLSYNQLSSLPEGFNPTVEGNLYLHNNQLSSLPEVFNPTVGGDLSLSYNQLSSLPEVFNPTVGGSLSLSNNQKPLTANKKDIPKGYIFSWQNGKYIMLDGILCEVISKKGGNYKIKIVGKTQESYLVIEGIYSAHGETLHKAKADLEFKKIAEKLKNEPIKADTIIDIKYYRLITGACESGVKHWMETNGVKKESFKAKELLPLLEKTNAYGLSKFKSLATF